MAKIKRIRALPKEPIRKKRVAAYARVSMESDNLLRSLSNQVSQYSKLIQSRLDWEYVGVYADSGISGTSTEQRDEFNRLLADCEDGKIDLILVKSISRFARNTVDLLTAVRHLKNIGVEVYFEEQNISSTSSDGEMMLTLLAAFAQEEAESIRQNVQWSVQRRFEQGIPNGHKRFLGYEWDGEQYVVIPEEAETVRKIFSRYLQGESTVQIAKDMKSSGAKNIMGEPISVSGIGVILDNENYTGKLLLQKRYSPSIGKRAANRGELPMYMVEDAHEPIIDNDTFQTVKKLRRERAAALPGKSPSRFSGILKCGYCGGAVCRRNVGNPKTNVIWLCNNVDKKGRSSCASTRRLLETELLDIVENVIEKDSHIHRIIVFDDYLEFQMYEGKSIYWDREFDPKLRGCFSRKLYCGECGEMLTRRARSRKGATTWNCKGRKKNICDCKSIHEEEIISGVKEVIGEWGNMEMRFFCNTDRVVVYEDRLEFYLKNGEVRTWLRK